MPSKQTLTREQLILKLEQELPRMKSTTWFLEQVLAELKKPRAVQIDFDGKEVEIAQEHVVAYVDEPMQVLERAEPADKSGAPRGPYGPRPKKPYPEWNLGSKNEVVNFLRQRLPEHPEGFSIVFMEDHLKTYWQNVMTTCQKIVARDNTLEIVPRSDWKHKPAHPTKNRVKGIRKKI